MRRRPDLLAGTIAQTTPAMDGLSARRARRRSRLEKAALLALAALAIWLLVWRSGS